MAPFLNKRGRFWLLMSVSLGALTFYGSLPAAEPKPVVKTQGFLPFGDAPIHYRTSKTLNDPITQLNRKLEGGETKLDFEPEHGYLKSVLRLLGVPVSSQTLVFSKTSLQLQHISPKTPRALYFNDNVYIGQVLDAKSLELIAFDSTQGAVFYVLGEQKADQPRFERAQLDCVQCHIASATRAVPGVMVRSVLTSASGNAKGGAPVYTMGHETPLPQRWGGWYVTGSQTAAEPPHMGNYKSESGPSAFGLTLPSLDGVVDTSRYLSGHSDIVAHLVLAHQTQMHNVVTETDYRFRLGGSYQNAAEAALRYLLFTAETPLASPVRGSSTFTADFAAIGPRDRKGRSLRDFDLQKRIFKYPCSYLIYSDAFDAIPGPSREYLLKRLFEVLSGRDQSVDFVALTAEDKRAILEILVDTKPGLPGEWKQFLEKQQQQHPVSQITTPAALR